MPSEPAETMVNGHQQQQTKAPNPYELLFDIEIDKTTNVVKNRVPFKAQHQYRTVAELIANSMNKNDDDRICLIEYETNKRSITFKDLFNRSKQFAYNLIHKHHLKQTDLIVFFSDNSTDYATTMLGAIFTGCTISPVTAANGKFELTQQIDDLNGTILIIDCKNKLSILKNALLNDQYRQKLLKNLRLIILMNEFNDEQNEIDSNDKILIEKVENLLKNTECKMDYLHRLLSINGNDDDDDYNRMKIPYFPINFDDYFIIIYTSGTTGPPKGAIHSNYSLLNSLVQRYSQTDTGNTNNDDNRNNQITIQKQQLSWYPMSHVSGTFILLQNIVQNYTTIMLYDNNIEKILKCIDDYQLMVAPISPKHAKQLLLKDYRKKFSLKSLKIIWTGGSKIPEKTIIDIQNNYNVILIESYGATEFLNGFLNMNFLMGKPMKIGSIGLVAPGCSMKIVDLETGKPLPAGERGELLINGPTRFVGYLNNEQATKNTIDSDGWYHSGDIAYYDDEGYVYIADRIKEIIKFREWSIIPGEIEAFLLQNPMIDGVCVVGVPHKLDINHLRAFVQLCDSYVDYDKRKQLADDIIESVKDNMGFQKRLRAGVEFIEHIPRTLIGKVDRKYFRSLVANELLTNVVE